MMRRGASLVGGSKQISGVSLILREGMFRFDSAERANRKPAAEVSLKVFDVRSGSVTELFERLYRAMANLQRMIWSRSMRAS
jgi:hypothetical protein